MPGALIPPAAAHIHPRGGDLASLALALLAVIILARRPITIWLYWRWEVWRGRRDLDGLTNGQRDDSSRTG
jgi:hypothetical protein